MKIKQREEREVWKKCKRKVIGKKKWVLPGIEPSEGIAVILKRPGEDTVIGYNQVALSHGKFFVALLAAVYHMNSFALSQVPYLVSPLSKYAQNHNHIGGPSQNYHCVSN